jgi:hypothetical protein
MMMGEWDIDAALMSNRDLKRRIAALEVLKTWNAFRQEFQWSKMFTLQITLQHILDCRVNAAQRGDVWMVVVSDIHCPARFFREKQLALDFQDAQVQNSGAINNLYEWNGKMWFQHKEGKR